MEVLQQVLKEAESGHASALVTVVRASGSTPRHVGAHMLVTADLVTAESRPFGSIGGGAVEHAVVETAAQVARGAPATRVEHHLVRDLAMCCGGTMELYIEPTAPSLEVLQRCVDAYRARQPVTLKTALDGSPKQLEEAPAEILHPQLAGEQLVEPIWPAPRLVLFGYGHLARAIAPIAQHLRFEVVICDDNETGAVEAVPPSCDRLVASFDVADVERELGGLGASDYLLILTRDHAIDQRIVEAALTRVADLAYLGLIGSLGKIGRFKKRILAKGVVGEDEWARLRAPMGLDIHAETPSEIAVSILAELVELRNRGRRR